MIACNPYGRWWKRGGWGPDSRKAEEYHGADHTARHLAPGGTEEESDDQMRGKQHGIKKHQGRCNLKCVQ